MAKRRLALLRLHFANARSSLTHNWGMSEVTWRMQELRLISSEV